MATKEMSDSELNEKVGRKLGWEKTSVFPSTSGNKLKLSGWQRPNTEEGVDWLSSPPDYCHSIQAAWAIVEHVQAIEEHWIAMRWKPKCEKENGGNWNCIIVWQKANETDSYKTLGEAYTPTCPMAIVKAFLKLEDK